jgi:DNA repair photolyase
MFVRWDNLKLEAEADTRLPGYRDAVVRTFDAPEALDTRFYEVYAKSAINKVPAASRMPFRFTINPYRGCSHACAYCSSPETPVLMADGRHRPIADLRAGDRIIGTVPTNGNRQFRITTVEDHWSSIKPAYRIVLEDGTELVASGDHRFLTAGRGWKHVTGSEQGRDRRPHLTTKNSLIGVGAFAGQPRRSDDYRRGYLCGLIRGDGHLKQVMYKPPKNSAYLLSQFRLALADTEALDRAEQMLAEVGVVTTRFAFHAATETQREITAIRAYSRAPVDRIMEIVAWPIHPPDDWCKGFLAGIFDAEGSCGRDALRISNCDPIVLAWTRACLQQFGFLYRTEETGEDNGMTYIRLLGGFKAQLRFFHLTDPAIRRKLWLDGRAIRTEADHGVVAIEPLGKAMRLFDITTGTGDFIANGVVSHNCFARPTHTYLDFNAGRDFEKEIVVKVNVPEVLRAELRKPSWKREHIAMGTNTDPYQWCESKYRLMPGIWEALRDFRNPCSVLTKSPLLLRDLELMKEIAAVTDIHANLSIPTLEEKPWRASEPHTPHPRKRIEAVAELNRAGIPTGVLIAPLMPGINDSPKQVEAILQACADAGATSVGGIALHLRGEVRDVFMEWLRSYRPDLVERYEELYARGAYVPREESDRIQRLLRNAKRDPETRLGVRSMRGVTERTQESGSAGERRVVQESLF